MIYDNKTIAIVGGGPGGLTLARLLQSHGAQVNVYERDKDKHVRQQGATLDLHQDSGLRALELAGLMDEFKAHYRPGADRMRVTDQEGIIRFDDHDEKTLDDFNDEFFRPEIDRGPLRDLLINSLQTDTIVWDAQFMEMQPVGNGWELHFKNGITAYADLVIAADGANSKLRKYVTDIKPIYSGITIVEGNIYNAEKNAPKLNTLLKGGKLFALGSEKSIILSAKGEGSLSFYTGTKEAENWVADSGIDFTNRHSALNWFNERYSDWSSIWQELFESDASYLIPRTMYHFPLDQHWETLPNLTMLGDAAHRMPPYAGEGVNMAMQDALELYECLINPDAQDMQQAIAQYEKKMLARAAEITEQTLFQTEALHSSDSLQYLIDMFGQTNDSDSEGTLN
jgi:2-polyprenyl-6-methoxyphenol hydroxylase-like FAD-dependent oxidoreductase